MTKRRPNVQVIVVGASHHLQAGSVRYTDTQRSSFQRVLEDLCEKHGIRFLAEEMSEDALADYGVKETIGRRVAIARGIKHRYIDLTNMERVALTIDRVSLHRIAEDLHFVDAQKDALEVLTGQLRECIWLVRILAENQWPTLLICGANHGPRVTHLFNCVGKHAELEINDYAP